jgi:hypothetical protein
MGLLFTRGQPHYKTPQEKQTEGKSRRYRLCILPFLSGFWRTFGSTETEVSEQLYV